MADKKDAKKEVTAPKPAFIRVEFKEDVAVLNQTREKGSQTTLKRDLAEFLIKEKKAVAVK